MILRRIIDHFRKQEWTAVAIDFVIVVIGVFIGIQVSNWNGAQADRAREKTYLTNLAEDLRSDIAEIDGIVLSSQRRMSALQHLIAAASGEPLPRYYAAPAGRREIPGVPEFADEDPYAMGFALFVFNTIDGDRTTYETLINTGGLGVLRDAGLVRDIQKYYAMVDEARDYEDSMERFRDDFIRAEHEIGVSPVDRRTPDDLVTIFRDNARLSAAAKTLWIWTARHLSILAELRREAEALADKIAKSSR